jgi:hypothetical protein
MISRVLQQLAVYPFLEWGQSTEQTIVISLASLMGDATVLVLARVVEVEEWRCVADR